MILLATVTTLIPYAYAAMTQLMLMLTDRRRFSGRRTARDATVAVPAFAYTLWTIAGPGYQVVYKGTLLLAGIPVDVWLKRHDRRDPVAITEKAA
ncbi:hypothetical protein [Nonomuraea harbinensis]|uniref:Uncharacterized protein n=1 Tax=Nonomuraea harbinensis TaxID=1286938 RepID=A0ABW1C8S5_9ACTN|nr:hypothetical protein [Nonomuraea harbinensis]